MSGARITCIEHVYHYAGAAAQPTDVQSIFTRNLDSDEQPWCRKIKVGEQWQPLDTGWLKEEVGMLVLQNDEGKFTHRQPTEEERAGVAAKVIDLGFVTSVNGVAKPFILLPPGESLRFTPADIALIQVRCRSGIAHCTLSLFPR